MATAQPWRAWRPPLHRELCGEDAPRLPKSRCVSACTQHQVMTFLMTSLARWGMGRERRSGEGGQGRGHQVPPLSPQPEDSHVLDPFRVLLHVVLSAPARDSLIGAASQTPRHREPVRPREVRPQMMADTRGPGSWCGFRAGPQHWMAQLPQGSDKACRAPSERQGEEGCVHSGHSCSLIQPSCWGSWGSAWLQ